MPTQHVVAQGDCLLSIADQYGHKWQTIWNDSDNADLKNKRKDPRVLQAGDVLAIPDLRLEPQSRPTDARHKFRRVGIPVKLRLRIQNNGQAVSNASWVCTVDGTTYKGNTDGDGILQLFVPPDATAATLEVTRDSLTLRYDIALGHLDPADSIRGIQGRLQNLGYYTGPLDGQLSTAFRDALRRFQKAKDLKVTGDADDATKDKLKDLHGT